MEEQPQGIKMGLDFDDVTKTVTLDLGPLGKSHMTPTGFIGVGRTEEIPHTEETLKTYQNLLGKFEERRKQEALLKGDKI